MVTRTVVQSAVHTTATALAHLPPEEWSGWVAYLCEELEQAAQTHGYTDNTDVVLQEIVDTLCQRIERGSW